LVGPGHPGGGAEPQSLTEVIKQVADELQKTGAQLQMEVDSDLGRVIVKVLDGQTGQVIRQIPAQELVNLAKQLKSLNGLLVEKHA
jgi:flagellar protein FlaG